jgi:hypothetical protein
MTLVDFTASTDDNAMNNLQENDVEATKSPFDALDDAFGDFSSPAGEKEAAAVSETGAENAADETVTKVETEAVEEAAEETNAVISDHEEDRSSPDGDVGYFSTHAKESENGIEESDSGQDSNDAGYFSADDATGGDDNEAVGEAEEDVAVNQSESTEKEETGDAADAQETAPEANLMDEPSESISPVQTEGATEASPEPAAGDIEAKKDTAGAEGENDDDFGDFGTFQQVEPVATESADATESVGNTLESNKESNVDGVQAQHELIPSAEAKKAEVVDNDAAKVSVGAETGDDDDDFGDFSSFEEAGEHPAAVADDSESPASDTMLPKQEQESADDDFGDFGSFEQADESPAQVNDVRSMNRRNRLQCNNRTTMTILVTLVILQTLLRRLQITRSEKLLLSKVHQSTLRLLLRRHPPHQSLIPL